MSGECGGGARSDRLSPLVAVRGRKMRRLDTASVKKRVDAQQEPGAITGRRALGGRTTGVTPVSHARDPAFTGVERMVFIAN